MDPTLFPFLDPLTLGMFGGAIDPYSGPGMMDPTGKGDFGVTAAPLSYAPRPQAPITPADLPSQITNPGVTLPLPTGPEPGSPDYYGGSPADNPNLKPVGQPQGSAADRLGAALRGVTIPKPPDAQRVSSPPPYRPSSPIKGGEILQLLALLNSQGQSGGGGLQLPNTLGAALLGGRRA